VSAGRGPGGAWLPALFAAFLAVVLVACGPDEAASPTPTAIAVDSGIQGTVLLGPTCAAQSVDASPCVTPYVAKLVILDADGNVVTEVSSNPDGTFKVSLPPGDYVIQPMPADGGIPNATPQSVTVAPHDYFDVEIDYDTGIR
jgi:hypothetical protein